MPSVKSDRGAKRKRFGARRQRAVVVVCGLVGVLVIGLTLLRASDRAPAPLRGQVVAKVGRREVTLEDVEAEARAQGRDLTPALRSAMLETVVARLLLEAAATAEGLDKSPAFPADRLRAEAQVLAEQYIRTLPSSPPPAPDAVTRYKLEHAETLLKRKRFEITKLGLRAKPPSAPAASHLSDLKAKLRAAGDDWTETRQIVYSEDLAPALLQALTATPVGSIVVWRDGIQETIYVVDAVEDAPLDDAQADAAAAAALVRQRRADDMKARLGRLRTQFRVLYQPGYGPRVDDKAQPTGEAR